MLRSPHVEFETTVLGKDLAWAIKASAFSNSGIKDSGIKYLAIRDSVLRHLAIRGLDCVTVCRAHDSFEGFNYWFAT